MPKAASFRCVLWTVTGFYLIGVYNQSQGYTPALAYSRITTFQPPIRSLTVRYILGNRTHLPFSGRNQSRIWRVVPSLRRLECGLCLSRVSPINNLLRWFAHLPDNCFGARLLSVLMANLTTIPTYWTTENPIRGSC
jgi:hypothetical protein